AIAGPTRLVCRLAPSSRFADLNRSQATDCPACARTFSASQRRAPQSKLGSLPELKATDLLSQGPLVQRRAGGWRRDSARVLVVDAETWRSLHVCGSPNTLRQRVSRKHHERAVCCPPYPRSSAAPCGGLGSSMRRRMVLHQRNT